MGLRSNRRLHSALHARAMHTNVGLRTKLIGLLSGVLLVFSIAFIVYTYQDQQNRTQTAMLEQTRMLVTEMDAVWDFVSINQHTINYTSDGTYDFKDLHCAIAGKAVAVLFSRNSDYSIRFTNLNPRNFYNAPDAYEQAALESFYAGDSSEDEVFGYADEGDEKVFRYVRTMTYTADCLECHGEPAGEIDLTGHPKEGKQAGDIAGAVSVVLPTTTYFQNMRGAVVTNALLFVALMGCMAVIIYKVLSHLVTDPLTRLTHSFAQLGDRSLGAGALGNGEHGAALAALYESREVADLFDQFDAMAGKLDELYANLESQVAERTVQLSAANRELEQQRRHVEEVNAQLVQDNRYKSDFLAIISHELRTPLTSIIAFTELLEQSIDPSETVARRQVEEVGKNSEILLEMVDNILATARIQAGSEQLQIELVDLNDIVGMVEASNESVALRRGVSLITEVKGDVPLIKSDWEKIRRILVNLVSNAIKFTSSGGSVDVDVRYDEPADQVVITVADTGIGIPDNMQELVFERFTQANMSAARRFGGSGLGLSLVKDFVAMLHGTVSLTSAVDEGSTFVVRLPVDGHFEDDANRGKLKGQAGEKNTSG